VIPDAKNLKDIFSEDEALFFKNEDENDLAQTLSCILANPSLIEAKGKNVHELIMNKYLWEQIFLEQARHMDNYINKKQ
ncbi:MAG: glycosyltransferase, partial [Chitinophagaceae bacterium]|nr:glycosyltransferase [Chitinophagaceae bacterium]